jgi:Mn2+/Fe2+ NRAMP family transporter
VETTRPWPPTRQDKLRAQDRRLVLDARRGKHPLLLMLLLVGPGILVMLGENDGPSMLSYATTGATYGIGFFVPFIAFSFLMAFVVQEMVVRLGIATHRGHAELIFGRFGKFWGYFSMVDLVIGNLLTLVTEFIAIQAGLAFFGVGALPAVSLGVVAVMLTIATRRYVTWERIALALALGNLLFVPAALFAHPDPLAVARALATWGPLPGGVNALFVTLVLANIGATVTPWMLFFQQSAVADKGLTRADLPQSRFDTALGAGVAAVAAIATLVAATPLFVHHAGVNGLQSGADFAMALKPYLGTAGASLFALGMIEAGLVAAMTISSSSSYALGEVLHVGRSMNLDFREGAPFYLTAVASVLIAAGIVLIPHAPLLAMTIAVNVIATLLMAPAILFVLLLINDRELVGSYANGIFGNVLGSAIIIGIALAGCVYGVVTVFPHVLPK